MASIHPSRLSRNIRRLFNLVTLKRKEKHGTFNTRKYNADPVRNSSNLISRYPLSQFRQSLCSIRWSIYIGILFMGTCSGWTLIRQRRCNRNNNGFVRSSNSLVLSSEMIKNIVIRK